MKKMLLFLALSGLMGCTSLNLNAGRSDELPANLVEEDFNSNSESTTEASINLDLPPDSLCSRYDGITCVAPVVTLPTDGNRVE